jgi:hypothetical protein
VEVRTELPLKSPEKIQALDQVLQSQTFARSDLLKKFLRYVSEMEDAGRGSEITEYSIGTEALGRPVTYSPADDSSVRGRAHDLRQKLEHFYEHERPDVRVRIGLHKGSYVPYFYEVAVAPKDLSKLPVVEAAQASHQLVRPLPTLLRRKLAVWALATVVLLVLSGGVWIYMQRGRQPNSILQQFWGPMLRPGSDVLLCLATPPSLRIKPFPAPPRHGGFEPAPKETAKWYSSLGLPGIGEPYLYHSTTSPLFGDAAAAVQAAQTIATCGGSFQFLPENIIVGQVALAKRNILVIGAPNYSPYAARVLRNTPFTIEESGELGEEIIRERTPRSGSPVVFVPNRGQTGGISVAFGLITVFPNRTGSEEAPRAIVVSGITGAGAPAAMEFFTSPAGLTALRNQFRKDGLESVPESYQVIVKGSRDDSMPLNWQLVTYRVMEHPPSLE